MRWGEWHWFLRLFSRPGAVVVAAGAAFAVISLHGFEWGLPSRERTALYGAEYHEIVGSGEERLFVTGPLQSYQVDECSVLIPLARMNPRRLELNPRWFHWGTLHIYLVGMALGVAQLLGTVTLTASRQFYLGNPEELATVYLIARGLSWALGLGSIALFSVLLRRVTRDAVISALGLLLLSVAPLMTLYGAFGTPDMAILFLVLLSAVLAGIGDERLPTTGGLLWAFVAAGAAASVKLYGGAAVAFPLVQAVRARRGRLLGTLCALVAFVAGSPYMVLDWQTFRADLAWQWNHMHHGHGAAFAGTRPGLVHHWLETLPAATSPLTTAVMALAVVAALVRRSAGRLPVLVFLAVFWLQLVRSPLKFARYTLPILPMHLLLVSWLLAETRSRWVRVLGCTLLVGALTSEVILSAGHARVFTTPDIRDRAATWLVSNSQPGDVVALPGKPYFATPPLSSDRFRIVLTTLDTEALVRVRPRWVILSDYDTEPLFRAPHELPHAHGTVHSLFSRPDSVRTFASSPRPPRAVTWGRSLLPHDMRYHCPTIWIVGT